MKTFVLVSNNPKAIASYVEHPYIAVEALTNGSYLDVLLRSRDLLHQGWHLVTHPQASNLKPNQCPFKTILLAQKLASFPMERDLELIENSISAFHKFTDGMISPKWPAKTLGDFQTIDLSVVESAIKSSLFQQLMMSNNV